MHHPHPAQPSKRLQEAQDALKRARKAADMLESAQKRLQQRREQREQAREDLSQSNEKIASLRSEQQAQASAEREMLDKLGELRDLPAIDQRLTEVRSQAKKNADAAAKIEERANAAQRDAATANAVCDSAAQAHREAQAAENAAARRLQQALEESGFEQQVDYAALLLSPERMEALEQTIQAYAAAVASADQQISRLQRELSGKEQPDLNAQRKRQAQAQEAAAQAAQAVGKLEQTALAAKESLGHLRKLEEKGKSWRRSMGAPTVWQRSCRAKMHVKSRCISSSWA